MKKIIAIFLSLLFLLPIQAKIENKLNGRILYVGGNGPNNYTKIQDAINDATDGDIIFVYSGIYYEKIRIDKSINLIGEDEEKTIIDGKDENAQIFKIEANNVNFSHFTIRNIKTDDWAYGIAVTGNNIKISNCITKNADGWGIYSIKEILIENCNFSNNFWGIQFTDKCEDITIKNCKITYNLGKKVGWGYRGAEGITLRNGYFYNVSIINCNLSNNRFSGIGGGYIENLYIENCTMRENDWGIHLEEIKNVSILNCDFKNNYEYGIDTISNATVFIKNCSFTETKNWSGISIYKNFNGKVIIDSCKIKNNENHGIEIFDSKGVYIRNSTICNNKIGIFAGSSIVDARYNYWGSKFGPSHLFGLRGDKIVARFSIVLYLPWDENER